jgi:hypothetical protein
MYIGYMAQGYDRLLCLVSATDTPRASGVGNRHPSLKRWDIPSHPVSLFSQHLLSVHRDKLTAPGLLNNLIKGCGSLVGIHMIIKNNTGGTCPVAVAQQFTDHTMVQRMQASKNLDD